MECSSILQDYYNNAAVAAMEIDSPFQNIYRCSFSPVEIGNRVIMPQSALPSLVDKGMEYPWVFELCNPLTGKTSHCGVLEFTSDEGFVLLPKLMMEFMEFEEGDLLTLKSVYLEKGTFVKLQPHTKNFMELDNPKAVLENTFRDYCCLTTADTILVMHGNDKFYVDIVEAKPSFAINVLDTDCEVDFALPLDYEPPPRKKQKKAEVVQKRQMVEEVAVTFKALTGIARRLDGEPLRTKQVAADNDQSKMTIDQITKPCRSSRNNVVPSQPDSTCKLPLDKAGVQEVTKDDVKKEVERFQAFTGRSYRLT